MRRSVAGESALEDRIVLPGLSNALSQIALPIIARGELLGVLTLQSTAPARFGADDEALLSQASRQIGLALALLRTSGPATVTLPPELPAGTSAPVSVRHYSTDDSVFIDNQYLIKGVAGQSSGACCSSTPQSSAWSSPTARSASTAVSTCQTCATT